MSQDAIRSIRNRVMPMLCLLAVLAALAPLLFILGDLVRRGAGALSLSFFTHGEVAPGEPGGGVAHAIVGSLLMVGTAALLALPLGIGAGLYCAEYPASRLAWLTRFVADVLNGTPSIVVGVVAWTLLVVPQGHFSGFAGAAALALLMVPMVMRTTEEMLLLVPGALREAALALGYARWRAGLMVVARAALPGIVTGALLAVARVAGETAPLLFTALGNRYFTVDLGQPMAALPTTVFAYASGPFEEWHGIAWGAALVLIAMVLVLSLAARLALRRYANRG